MRGCNAQWSGACHDGLSPAGVNANQGAESTLAYHQAHFSLCSAPGWGRCPPTRWLPKNLAHYQNRAYCCWPSDDKTTDGNRPFLHVSDPHNGGPDRCTMTSTCSGENRPIPC